MEVEIWIYRGLIGFLAITIATVLINKFKATTKLTNAQQREIKELQSSIQALRSSIDKLDKTLEFNNTNSELRYKYIEVNAVDTAKRLNLLEDIVRQNSEHIAILLNINKVHANT